KDRDPGLPTYAEMVSSQRGKNKGWRYCELSKADPSLARDLDLWLNSFNEDSGVSDSDALDFFFDAWDSLEPLLAGASEEMIGYAQEWLGEIWVTFDYAHSLAMVRVNSGLELGEE